MILNGWKELSVAFHNKNEVLVIGIKNVFGPSVDGWYFDLRNFSYLDFDYSEWHILLKSKIDFSQNYVFWIVALCRSCRPKGIVTQFSNKEID